MGGRRGCGGGEGVLLRSAAVWGRALRAGFGPLPPPPPASRWPPTTCRPHGVLFLCFLQGGALPAGVETMVLTLAESWPVLVGKRFLSLSAADRGDGGHDGWDVGRVAEWPWLSGTIRAVSHTDVTKKDLKVTPGPRRSAPRSLPLCGKGDRKVGLGEGAGKTRPGKF